MKERPYYGMKEVQHLIGRSYPTVYRWRKSGYMPEPVLIGPRMLGWYKESFDKWLLSRPVKAMAR